MTGTLPPERRANLPGGGRGTDANVATGERRRRRRLSCRGGANARGAGRAGTRRGRRVQARAILPPRHPRAENEIASSSPRRGATAGMPSYPSRVDPFAIRRSFGTAKNLLFAVIKFAQPRTATSDVGHAHSRVSTGAFERIHRAYCMNRSSIRRSPGLARARSPNPPERRRISSTDPRFCSSSPCPTHRRTPWPSPSSTSPSPPCSSCSWP